MFINQYETEYTTVIRKDSYRFMLISKQHKCITDIDKMCFISFLALLPFGKFITIESNPFLISNYYLLLGIFFGRSSSLIIFNIVSQPRRIFAMFYVACVLFSILF